MSDALAGVSDEGKIANLLNDDPSAHYKASIILADFRSFGRNEFPFNAWQLVGFNPKILAISPREVVEIMMVLIMGMIGSIIYLFHNILRISDDNQFFLKKSTPLPTFFLRPLFGLVVAFAIYLLYKTGQVTFSSGGLSTALQSEDNIHILAVVGLFTGLLSSRVLEIIKSKAEEWLPADERRDRWAAGLKRVLEAEGKSRESCAQQVGCTISQIDRWIAQVDRVTPEMQDRVTGWLGIKREEIFSSFVPTSDSRDRSMYAVGLRPYLQRADARYDAARIAKELMVEPETVDQWRDQELAVASKYQWQLVELLGERHGKLFDTHPNKPQQ